MNLHDNEVDELQDVFEQYFEEIQGAGADLAKVVWLLPRVETAVCFKRSWQRFHQGKACLAPPIQTADRISQPINKQKFMALQADLVTFLSTKPWVSASSSTEQLWGLAGECLQLAMRLALRAQAHAAVKQYAETGYHSQIEASLVMQIAEIYHDDLIGLWARPQVNLFKKAEQVVWFDDGEPLPELWLSAFVPSLPIKRVSLPIVEGDQPWVQLARHLAGASRLKVSLAPDTSTQTQQAAATVLNWLAESPNEPILIAVVDRLAARRLVPVLAKAGVLVDDRTGWKFSTSKVAGWFVSQLNQAAVNGSLSAVTTPLGQGLIELSDPFDATLNQPLSMWAKHWLDLLSHSEIDAVLWHDEAGRLLLGSLRDLACLPAEARVSCEEFTQSWYYLAEQIRFRPEDVVSPVRLMPLLSTRLQKFDRALVLGCAQSQFQPNPPGLLPPAVAGELGFPGPGLARLQLISSLYELLLNSRQISVFHAESASGQPETLLPEMQWLDICIRREAGETALANLSDQIQQPWANSVIEAVPKPNEPLHIDNSLLKAEPPSKLRVTSLDSWTKCKLQFGLGHGLRLNTPHEQTQMAYFQLRGIYVHRVLEIASLKRQSLDGGNLNDWKQALAEAGEAVFGEMSLEDKATLYPFYEYFKTIYPQIAGVFVRRYSEGWRAQGLERMAKGRLELKPSGRSIEFSGRVDRLEARGEQLCIVDIKYKDVKTVKEWANNPMENPQLPAYQRLLQRPSADLAYLAVHKDGTDLITLQPPEEDGKSWGEALWGGLATELDAFFTSEAKWQPTPGKHCDYCEFLGVCRPDRSKEVEAIDE